MTHTYITLLRAVNVGGSNALPTKHFVQILTELGLRNVRTYIQTGNAVFQTEEEEAADLTAKIGAAIERHRGFAPEVMVLRLDELESAIAANPYPEAEANPKSVHLTFLTVVPQSPDLTALENLRKDSERFTLDGRVFYLYAPEGVARSKLFQRIERALGVAGTARNWRTTCKLLEIARDMAAGNTSTAG